MNRAKPSSKADEQPEDEKGKKKKEKEKIKPRPRSSKNAPQEISSKRAVTRKREVVEPTITHNHPGHKAVRDPRFDTAVNGRYDEHEFRKNYAFLDDYRDAEIKMIKEEAKKTRDEGRREELARKIKSMVPSPLRSTTTAS